MRSVIFSSLRSSLLAAMGVAVSTACATTVTTEGGAGSGGASSSSSSSTGAGNAPSTLCEGATPMMDMQGNDTGFAQCPDTTIHRVSAETCDTTNRLPACDSTAQDMRCTTDADCTERPNGKCSLFTTPDFGGGEYISCGCSYACGSDADCGVDEVCICDNVAADAPAHAFCAPADCTTNDDCASGECGLSIYNDGCGTYHSLACRNSTDPCRLASDCPDSFQQCAVSYDAMGQWACVSDNCAIGRPMMVDGRARTAPVAHTDAWTRALDALDVSSLDRSLRDDLAAHWSAVARLEHASVASFARFILQLMAVGAPSELVREAQRALSDEVDHAELAFGFASAYAGEPLGPGPMDMDGATVATDLASVLIAVAEEACVGETLGVAEALATAEQVTDPVMKRALQRIADDEMRHAGLAWKTMRWGLQQANAETRARVRLAMDRAMTALAPDPPLSRQAAPEHGLLSGATIGAVRRQALRDVVQPCADTLFGALA